MTCGLSQLGRKELKSHGEMSERSMAHPEATQKCPKARTENTGAQGGMDKHPGKDRHGSS